MIALRAGAYVLIDTVASERNARRRRRKALTKVSEWMAHRIATGGFEASATIPTMLEGVVLPALAKPPRDCDRFGGDIDKLREACARERGMNPEEDFPEVLAEWLLAPSTERKGGGAMMMAVGFPEVMASFGGAVMVAFGACVVKNFPEWKGGAR